MSFSGKRNTSANDEESLKDENSPGKTKQIKHTYARFDSIDEPTKGLVTIIRSNSKKNKQTAKNAEEKHDGEESKPVFNISYPDQGTTTNTKPEDDPSGCCINLRRETIGIIIGAVNTVLITLSFIYVVYKYVQLSPGAPPFPDIVSMVIRVLTVGLLVLSIVSIRRSHQDLQTELDLKVHFDNYATIEDDK